MNDNEDKQFAKAVVHKRSINNVRKNRKYFHIIMNERLIGLSGTARDVLDYIRIRISNSEYTNNTRYYLYVDSAFKDDVIDFLKTHNSESSKRSVERAIKDLVDRNILLPINKGKYLYNFKDFGHIGNNEQWSFDIIKYDILTVLEEINKK